MLHIVLPRPLSFESQHTDLGTLDSAFESLSRTARGIPGRAEISFAIISLVPCSFQRLFKVITERRARSSCMLDDQIFSIRFSGGKFFYTIWVIIKQDFDILKVFYPEYI